jgi:LmbE family N-acetylglucosaminyl deacetylase
MKLPERLRWKHLMRFYEGLEPFLKASALKQKNPDFGRVLVLAPHIDDDIIGCGGCLRKHAVAGDEIKIIYFADCTPERIKEAEAAAGVIGTRHLEFLGYGSKTLMDNDDIAERLAGLIRDYGPDIIYLPSFLDRHNDHLAVNHIFSLLTMKHDYRFLVYAYEVWSTLVPNLIVDISSEIEKKREALRCFKSQIIRNDWVEAAAALNRYRGITSGAGAYAEGFIRYSAKEYAGLLQRVFGR